MMLPEKFREKVHKIGECEEWVAGRDKDGYGMFRDPTAKTTKRTHRYVWEQVNGPIPKGMCILHSCDNPSCVRIDHLRIGTHRENMDERSARGRTARGAKSGQSKITEEDVIEIRRLSAAGLSAVKIGKLFGLGHTQTHNIAVGKKWSHINHEATN